MERTAALRRVGRWWLLSCFAQTGVTTAGGVAIQPLMWVAPPLLLAALLDLRRHVPQGTRRLLDLSTAVGTGAWAAGLASAADGGAGSTAANTSWSMAYVAFALFAATMARWMRSVGAREAARSWRWPAATSAIVVAALSVPALVRVVEGQPLSGDVEVTGATGEAIIVALVVGTIGPMVWAFGSMRATRAWSASTEPGLGTSSPPAGPDVSQEAPPTVT